MKKEFQVLKDRPQIPVVLTRDSVSVADDCDAPHEKTLKVYSFADPEALARETSSGYLPIVASSGHSWICILNGVKIAEIKTTGIQSLVRETTYDETNRIHFIYKSASY